MNLRNNIMDQILPKDWKWVKLGEVCKLKNGFAFKSTEYRTDGVPIIRISDIKIGYVKPDNSVKVSPKKEYEEYIVREDEILVAMSGATTGKFGIFKSKEKVYQNQRVGKFQILNELILDKNFLLYQLHALKRQIEKDAYGGAQPNISSSKIEAMEILLPPKKIQQSIVSKIEELFSELDKGIETLHTAQQQLKTYRQAVLKWAFEGRLTNENVKQGELPEGWKSVELGSVCSLITDGKHGDCLNEENSGFFFLSAKDVRNNTLLWDNARQITKSEFEETHKRTNLKPGDICLVNTGATIGRISIAPKDERTFKTTFQKSVAVIKCIPNLIDNEYCKYFLQGDLKKLVKVSSGTAVPNLLLGSLKKHCINLPSDIIEQNRIIQEIECRLSVADKLEESITENIQKAETLRQSILKRAFEGKLFGVPH
jgi:type I restriction enzyme S subunit